MSDFEAELYVTLVPVRSRDNAIIGARVGDTYRNPRPGAIRCVFSIPENYFNSPTVRIDVENMEFDWEGWVSE